MVTKENNMNTDLLGYIKNLNDSYRYTTIDSKPSITSYLLQHPDVVDELLTQIEYNISSEKVALREIVYKWINKLENMSH